MDPEVLADLRLRERTAAERSAASPALYAWKPPVFVGAWKCRTCEVLVPITTEDLERLAMWNRVLRSRKQEPIDHNRIVFCDACRDSLKAKAGDRRSEEARITGELVRELKAATNPDSERATANRLRDLGHPDVDGLLGALRERAGYGPAKRKGKAVL